MEPTDLSIDHESSNQAEARDTHWPSVIQLVLSLFGAICLLGFALLLSILGLIQYIDTSSAANDALSLFLMSAGLAFAGLLLLPSSIYSFLRLSGRSATKTWRYSHYLRPTLIILTLPFILLLGYWISGSDTLAVLLLPLIHVCAVGIPVFWLAYLGYRDLPLGNPQRSWGVFSSGMILAPLLIFLVEVLALIVFVIIGVIFIANRPELIMTLNSLGQQLTNSSPSPEVILDLLGPYLVRPSVIVTVFLFVAVVVPLIEELIKPIGVWLLMGRKLSAAAGFAAGVLSGSGFALFESLALTSDGEAWSLIVFARIGTAVIHILTAGITGWALVQAWSKKRYFHLGITYLLAVLIHSLWNSLTLLNVIATLTDMYPGGGGYPFISQLGSISPYILLTLSVLGFGTLLLINRMMYRQENEKRHQVVEVGVV